MLRLTSRGHFFSFDRPVVMGIMNVTPDSFFDGGKYQGLTAVLEHCHKMVSDGADIIDIGAFSTRPGSARISDKGGSSPPDAYPARRRGRRPHRNICRRMDISFFVIPRFRIQIRDGLFLHL